jgi:hypothetical protein
MAQLSATSIAALSDSAMSISSSDSAMSITSVNDDSDAVDDGDSESS